MREAEGGKGEGGEGESRVERREEEEEEEKEEEEEDEPMQKMGGFWMTTSWMITSLGFGAPDGSALYPKTLPLHRGWPGKNRCGSLS